MWYNPNKRKKTVVPHHSGSISKGTLRAIIKQAGLSIEEFIILL
ncbi:MAG: type II toxin-antitoxin system HicA family toxin [Bacteroidetes bacterium]|nr:type II toxin-antitoxin system HicA family toxin [Bacteroidota bacterium]